MRSQQRRTVAGSFYMIPLTANVITNILYVITNILFNRTPQSRTVTEL